MNEFVNNQPQMIINAHLLITQVPRSAGVINMFTRSMLKINIACIVVISSSTTDDNQIMSNTKTTVGDRVKLVKDDLVGVVRFNGEIQGKKGIWFGIELDAAKGKNNGTVSKVKYFNCASKKGLFVKKTGIAKTNKKHNPDAPRVEVGDAILCKKSRL